MAIKELFYDQRPVALLNPRASQRIDPRFKFTRDSIGTYVDSTGIVRTVAANQPRIMHSGEGSAAGLLLEESRQNLVLNSERFDISPWTQVGITSTPNSIAAPDGLVTGTLLQLNPGTYNFTYVQQGIVGTATRALSVFAKAGNYQYIKINPRSFGGVGGAVFDLSNGTVHSVAPTAPPLSTSIEEYPDGWYRIGIVTTSDGGATVLRINLTNLVNTDNDTGTVSSARTAYVWGAQLELGGTLSSYIPTGGIAVTRVADLLSIDSLSIPSTGSVYIDARAITAEETDTLISLKNASNEKINLSYESNAATYNSLALIASYKGTSKSSLPLPVPTTARERNIITWGANNYQYTTDSSRYAASLSSSVPANLTQLSIGHDAVDPTKAFNGYINAVYLYNGEITPAVAEALVRGELDPINADTYSPVGPTGSLALVINTQGATADGDKTFTLPAESALNDNDIVITWGDGTESGLDGASAELGASGLTHTYPAAGIYPVWVEGQLENLQFNNIANAPDLVQITAWGTTANGNDVFRSPSTMNSAFYGCSQMDFSTSARTTNLPDTSAVTNWYRAFSGCSSITGTFPSFNFSGATSFQEAWQGCSGLTSFTAAGDQTQNVTIFSSAWSGCTSLTSFPLINTAAGTNFSFAWSTCTSLSSFPLINTAAGTNFAFTWYACSGLTSFPLINTANATSLYYTWNSCTNLTSFPLINTGSCTEFGYAWYGCSGLTSFPLIDTSSGTSFFNTWTSCSGLTSFPQIDTSAGTNFNSTWLSCSGLTSFPQIVTTAGTDFFRAWRGCSSLAAFPTIDTAAGTNFSETWRDCSGLTSFPALNFNSATGLASDGSTTYTGFRSTWQGCSSLTDFPADRFNSTTCTRFLDAWTGCALTAQSIENILVSINTANTSNGNLGIGGGTNAAKTTWSTAANNAYDALVARGWTITYNA